MEMNATLLAQIPAGAPPPGVIPNFVNPYSTAQSGKIENVVCIVLTTTIVWAKMYTKLHIMRQSGWEDCEYPPRLYAVNHGCKDDLTLHRHDARILGKLNAIRPSTHSSDGFKATYIAYVGISFVPLDGGAGVHQWDLYLLPVIHSAEVSHSVRRKADAKLTSRSKQYLNIAEVLYVLSICLVKVSILLQLLRIFNPARNTALFVLAWGLIVINILLYTGVGLATIFQCNPRERIWNPLISGTCLNEYAIFISGAAMNLASDIILLILPLRSVWKLQMKLKQKLQVSAVFVVGLL